MNSVFSLMLQIFMLVLLNIYISYFLRICIRLITCKKAWTFQSTIILDLLFNSCYPIFWLLLRERTKTILKRVVLTTLFFCVLIFIFCYSRHCYSLQYFSTNILVRWYYISSNICNLWLQIYMSFSFRKYLDSIILLT